MASISEVFDKKYPELSKQLEEIGIKDCDALLLKFETNDKYLVETLNYELKDNEIIASMCKDKDDKNSAIFAIVIFGLMAGVFYWLWSLY